MSSSIIDLWTQYWSSHPLLDVWHAQTFARQTSHNFASCSNSTWSPEIKKTIEYVAKDLRMKQVRSFFLLANNNTNATNAKNGSSAAAAFSPSSVLEFNCSPSTAVRPREVFDLFLTLLTTTRDFQQTTILDFHFADNHKARVTFASPLIAQRVASSLQGIADVRLLSQKEVVVASSSSGEKQQQMNSLNHSVLVLRSSTLSDALTQAKCKPLQQVFNIFGCHPKLNLVNNSCVKIEFSSTNPMEVPKSLALSEGEEFFAGEESNKTTEDAAPTSSSSSSNKNNKNKDSKDNKEDDIFSQDSLRFLSSDQEAAMSTLVNLQRLLAEDWGLMLTFERK